MMAYRLTTSELFAACALTVLPGGCAMSVTRKTTLTKTGLPTGTTV